VKLLIEAGADKEAKDEVTNLLIRLDVHRRQGNVAHSHPYDTTK